MTLRRRPLLAGMLAVAADSTRDETLRQVGIESGKPEGQGARRGRDTLHSGQQATQLVHDRGPMGAALAKDGGRR